MNLRPILACTYMIVFMGVALYAQQSTATVTGIITDPSGAAIAGANIKLENTERGVSRTAETGADGRFFIEFVTIGAYKITVSQSGFNSVARSMDLTTGQVLDVPLQLQVQQQAQTVDVQAQATALATSSVEQVATLSLIQIKELPVAHLDWTNLLALSPGTTRPPQGITINSTSPVGSGVNVNGLPSAGYSFTVDGTNSTNNMEFTAFNFYQAAGLINGVNNAAIEEVSVVKGVPAATVGGGMSGNINIVTKGATNGYHGTIHEISEVSLFDARNQFLTSRPRTTFADYGVSMGLPIIKNKLFFFGSFEAASQSSSKVITGGVPSPYLRSIAPAVYKPLFDRFPLAPQPGNNPTATTSQYFGTGSNLQQDNNGVYRLDYYVNPTNSLALRLIRSRPFVFSPALLPSNPRNYYDAGTNFNVTYTHSSAHLATNSRYGYNRTGFNRIDATETEGLPNVSFLGWNTAGGKLLNWFGHSHTFQQAASYVSGMHTIQFGGIIERSLANELQIAPVFIQYANLTQFLNNTPSQFQLQIHSLPNGQPYFQHITNQTGAYVQDDIRLNSSLTFNLGVRYDYWTVPGESGANRVFNRDVDPLRPELGPGFGPIINYYYKPDHSHIQPRIGLAYNLGGKGKTVVRAGFGKLSMGHTLYSAVVNQYQLGPNTPFQFTMNQAQTTASGLKYPYNPDGFLQDLTRLQANGVISPELAATQSINTHFPNPYSLQWTVGIQQALPWNMSLEVDYNGNRGLHMQFQEVLNRANRLTGVSPKPTFGAVSYVTLDDRSKYAALQTTIRKRLQSGLAFSVAFNYSRVSSFSDADNLQSLAPQDPYNFHTEWGPAPFDINRRLVTNAIYDIPFTKWLNMSGRKSKLLLGGWQVSGVFSAQSGLPANITNGASTNGPDRPDAAPGGISPYVAGFETGVHQYITAAAFTQIPISSLSAQQIRPGNLSRMAIRLPGAQVLDASLAKNVFITERLKLQLRADTFNTLNHTNLFGMVTTITSATFGRLTQATARTMQVGARITF